MIDKVQDFLNRSSFAIRQNYLSHFSFRNTEVKITRDTNQEKFYSSILNKFYSSQGAQAIELVFDIGSRNWSYVMGLASVFKNAKLIGIEVDGNRFNRNLYKRKDYGFSFANLASRLGHNAEYKVLDFRNCDLGQIKNAKTVFCFFFPFVSERPCIKWGLPKEFSNFYELIHKINLQSLPDFEIISAHQGEWEVEVAEDVYKKLGFKIKVLQYPKTEFQNIWQGMYDVFVIFAKKC